MSDRLKAAVDFFLSDIYWDETGDGSAVAIFDSDQINDLRRAAGYFEDKQLPKPTIELLPLVPLDLSVAIERELPHALTQLRAHGWVVTVHYDSPNGDSSWVFSKPALKRYVEAVGSTYAQAVYHAQVKAQAGPPHPIKCPKCDKYLPENEAMSLEANCDKCGLFYSLGCWWVFGCDEAHSHRPKCMTLCRQVPYVPRDPGPTFTQYMLRMYGVRQSFPAELMPIEHAAGATPEEALASLDVALARCAQLAKRTPWPHGEFGDQVKTVVRTHMGSCGHIGHPAGCQCENDD